VTGTAAQTGGYRFIGIEAHPLVAELAGLKLAIPPADSPRHAGLPDAATAVVEDARKRVTDISKAGHDEPDLVRRSFLPDQLEELVALRESVKELGGDVWAPYLKWALLGVLRDVAVVKVGWPYQRPGSTRQPPHSDPSERFMARARMIAEDLVSRDSASATLPSARMICGDARNHAAWAYIPDGSAAACVASPPYLNNFDYADATRLELYFWGEITSWRDMCTNVRAGMITATTQQSSVGASRQALDVLASMGEVGKQVRELTDQLTRERTARTRGKEYDRVLPDYFVGISQVLTHLWQALAPGARCVWLVGDSAPYGVYVDTPRLIGELAERAGFHVVDDVVLRERGRRWQTNTGRHSTALSERLLLFDRRHNSPTSGSTG
jgi:hypothetical protein